MPSVTVVGAPMRRLRGAHSVVNAVRRNVGGGLEVLVMVVEHPCVRPAIGSKAQSLGLDPLTGGETSKWRQHW